MRMVVVHARCFRAESPSARRPWKNWIVTEVRYDDRTFFKTDCRHVYTGFTGPGTLGKPLLVSVYRLCGPEPVAIRIHQLVPHDDVFAPAGGTSGVPAQLAGNQNRRCRCQIT